MTTNNFELSLNQATTRPYGLGETARAAYDAGIRHLGLWLEPVAELGITKTRQLLDELGLGVTSMCRDGFVAPLSGTDLTKTLDHVRRSIDTCHEVGAPVLTFIAGGLPDGDRNIANAETRVRAALQELVPHARQAGVRLALEPLHPLFVDDRSMVTTVAQGLRVIDGLPEDVVGLMIDAYATYWDPDLDASLSSAGARIAGCQVSDFTLPLPVPENMNGRQMPGTGTIDLEAFVTAVSDNGYRAPIEVEIFNDEIWKLPLTTIVERTRDTFYSSLGSTAAAV